MAKYIKTNPKPFAVVKVWQNNDQNVYEYFETIAQALDYITNQEQPKNGEFEWCVGQYC